MKKGKEEEEEERKRKKTSKKKEQKKTRGRGRRRRRRNGWASLTESQGLFFQRVNDAVGHWLLSTSQLCCPLSRASLGERWRSVALDSEISGFMTPV